MAQPRQVQTTSQLAVQEYMETLLVDLFPAIPDEQVEAPEASVAEAVETELQDVVTPETAVSFIANEPDISVASAPVVETAVETAAVAEAAVETVTEPIVETVVETPVAEPEVINTVAEPVAEVVTETKAEETAEAITETVAENQTEREVGEAPKELRYPNAPEWAQEEFDVLLFDVCGLKLAIPMESLGRIIKVEHETNHLIGRPNWFMGAYSEAEQRLFVVDTARYIMPEKGLDLESQGFDYIIQLQRTQWTLACKNVKTTVRLQPDQVKWRSAQGKRKWLAGTVVDQMCALLHADSLIELLNSEVPEKDREAG